MKINNDFKELLKIFVLFLLQFYKIIMGTMLTLFVPQKCDILSYNNNTELPYKHKLCSFDENVDNMNYLTFVFNCLTAGMFVLLYIIELKREYWLIHTFDIDHNLSDNNLAILFENNSIIKQEQMTNIIKKLNRYNNYYFIVSILTCVVFIPNNLLAINILYDRNYGSASLNTFISFLLLIMVKLYNSLSISYHSRRKHKALSSFLTEFSSFNVLDEDVIELYKEDIESRP